MTSHASTRALSELSASAIASTLDARNRDALVTAIASLSRRGGESVDARRERGDGEERERE